MGGQAKGHQGGYYGSADKSWARHFQRNTVQITLSAEEYEAYLQRNATWNFIVNTLDLTFYNLAVSFVFGSTVLALYASYLTESAVLIGLIPAIQSVGYFWPQLLASRRAEQHPRKLPAVRKISVMERLPYLFVTLGILLWPDAPRWLAYAILAISLALATGSGGLAGPGWNSMLAKVIRPAWRGRMFGISHAAGALLGVGGARLSGHILQNYAYPISFGICFGLCFIFQVMSWICLSLNREPAKDPQREALSVGAYWRHLPQVLRENPNFARYLIAQTLLTLGAMATSFYVVYARNRFQVGDAFAANLTIAALISQAASLPILGWLADRRGHKWLLERSALFGIAGILLILVSPSAAWLYGVFMLVNIAASGSRVAGLSIIMEFCEPDAVPTFSALASTLLGIPVLLAPLLGGWIVEVGGFRMIFLVSLAVALLGWAMMRWSVREPRHERIGQG